MIRGPRILRVIQGAGRPCHSRGCGFALRLKQKIFVGFLAFAAGLLGLVWSDPSIKVNAGRPDHTSGSPREVPLRAKPDLHEFAATLPLSLEQNAGQLDSRA